MLTSRQVARLVNTVRHCKLKIIEMRTKKEKKVEQEKIETARNL